jgi:hypothetical protein
VPGTRRLPRSHAPSLPAPARAPVAPASVPRPLAQANGLQEDYSTYTSLLKIFGDSQLAEDLVSDWSRGHEGAEWDNALVSPRELREHLSKHPRDLQRDHQHRASDTSALEGETEGEGEAAEGEAGDAAAGGERRRRFGRRRGFGTRRLQHVAEAHGASDADELRVMHTDLRGMTRPAAYITLRRALRRAAIATGRGEPVGAGWEILTREAQPDPMARWSDTSLQRLATNFLRTAQIGYELTPRGVRVVQHRLERAAEEESIAARTHAILHGSLLRITMVTAVIAAMAIVPRLATLM